MGMGGQRHAPAALPRGKRTGIYCTGSWVGPRASLDRWGKSRPLPGFDSRTVQPVASRYTEWDIPVHKYRSHSNSKKSLIMQDVPEIPEYGTTSWECCCTQSRKKVHVNMISDALCVSRVIFVYFGKKRYKNYCVYPSAEERVYFQTTDFKVLEYYFDRKKGIEVLYAQNIIQHPALKVNSICRGNYWGPINMDFDAAGQLLIL